MSLVLAIIPDNLHYMTSFDPQNNTMNLVIFFFFGLFFQGKKLSFKVVKQMVQSLVLGFVLGSSSYGFEA